MLVKQLMNNFNEIINAITQEVVNSQTQLDARRIRHLKTNNSETIEFMNITYDDYNNPNLMHYSVGFTVTYSPFNSRSVMFVKIYNGGNLLGTFTHDCDSNLFYKAQQIYNRVEN